MAPLPGRNQEARMTEHLLAQLACLGTHTITGLLSVCGRQFGDWSADYRLYERGRTDPERLFEPTRQWLTDHQEGPIVLAMDDTHLRKAGAKVHGAQYRRDPMGPPFQVNLVRAQRFLQLSMALKGKEGAARMIPTDWTHAPLPKKPKRDADEKALETYKTQKKEACLSRVAVQRVAHLRKWFDRHGAQDKKLWVAVDASFANATVLKNLPPNTHLIARVRADAKLYHLPERQKEKGRKKVYGEPAPTPRQLHKDETVPWQNIEVFFGKQRRTLKVKRSNPVRWRTAGEQHTLQMIVVAPTPYRLTQKGKLLYRQPAYLVCTDPDAPIADVVQYYLWRWDIEVNHRDEKTLLGVGDAQVRTPEAVQNVTGCAVAAYAMLLTAAAQCRENNTPCQHIPLPKWRRRKTAEPTTMQLIQNLRYELWARSIHFSGFVVKDEQGKNPNISLNKPENALFYTARYT